MAVTTTTTFSRIGDSVRNLREEADRVVSKVRARVTSLARSPVKELGNLADDARRVRGDVRQQVEKAVRRIEAGVEQRVSQVVKPVAKYLDVVSREEIEQLNRRVSALEKRLHALDKSEAA